MMNVQKVLVFLLTSASLGSARQCSYSEATITCREIQQQDFLPELLALGAMHPTGRISTIEIFHSNFSRIDYLSNPSTVIDNFEIEKLTMDNCSIAHIGEQALSEFRGLKEIKLRSNQIENTSFVRSLGNALAVLDLSRNSLRTLDLGDFQSTISSIHLQGNEIDTVIPTGQRLKLVFMDLSHNGIEEFNATYLNCFTNSIDLSYNRINQSITLSLDDIPGVSRRRGVVNIRMNNVSSLGESGSYWNEIYSTSLIKGPLYVGYILSFKDSNISVLDKTVWDISDLSSDGVLDLSNASISKISENYFDRYIPTLNLSHNNISLMNFPIFKARIENIDLSFSGIKNISGNAFSDRFYSSLNLSGNQFEALQDICQTAKFQFIDLSFNALKSIGSETFSNCYELTKLRISHAVIEVLEPEILTLAPIELLDLSSTNLSQLQPFTFSNSSRISEINLSNTTLKIIQTNVFYNLSVTTLSFSNSDIYYLAAKAFNGLYNLKLLDLSGCGISHIEQDAFYDLPHLESLDLHSNMLVVVETHSFRNMWGLSVNLSWNKVELLRTDAFQNVDFTSLDLSWNNLSGIPADSFSNATIRNLLLPHNNISASVSFDWTNKVTSLWISFNGVFIQTSLSSVYLRSLSFVGSSVKLVNSSFVGFPYLRALYFDSSRVEALEAGTLRGLYSLETLDSSTLFSNTETLWNTMFSETFALKTLLLDSPLLTKLEAGCFSNLQRLEVLNITGTRIDSLPFDIFDQLGSLRVLDLSHNSLNRLDSKNIFMGVSHLTELYLQGNALNSLSIGLFGSLSQLRTLRLDSNSLSGIEPGVFNGLDSLKVLNLSQNKQLFLSNSRNTFTALKTLNGLESLFLDNTYIGSDATAFGSLGTFFPSLRRIDINNNLLRCDILSDMLIDFSTKNIIFTPVVPTNDVQNLKGIKCMNSN